jgi:hypothetical protein
MGRIIPLLGATLILSISAAAQGPAGVGARRGPQPQAPSQTRPSGRSQSIPASELAQWQLSAGYQYNQINLTGSPFHTSGVNVSVVRFLNGWLGVEGQVGMGFGKTGTTTTPANLTAKSLYIGGGPRLAYRGRWRFEPWVHGNAGVQYFRFSQTAGVLGTNSALAGLVGGGVDYPLTLNTTIRGGVDFIGTRFFSTQQRHFQATAGVVLNF